MIILQWCLGLKYGLDTWCWGDTSFHNNLIILTINYLIIILFMFVTIMPQCFVKYLADFESTLESFGMIFRVLVWVLDTLEFHSKARIEGWKC